MTAPITSQSTWASVFESMDSKKILAPLQTVRKDGGTALGAIAMVERQIDLVGVVPIRKSVPCIEGLVGVIRSVPKTTSENYFRQNFCIFCKSVNPNTTAQMVPPLAQPIRSRFGSSAYCPGSIVWLTIIIFSSGAPE